MSSSVPSTVTDPESRIRERFGPDEEVLLLTETDIARDGQFGRRWFAVTSRRMATFAADGAVGEPELEVPLEGLKSVSLTHLVGQGALEAEADGRKVEVLRCSNALTERFSGIARSLTEARKEDRLPEFRLAEEEERHCPQCGRLLPEKGSFCPACLKKREVLARFWSYIRPHWPKALGLMLMVIAGSALRLVPMPLNKTLVDDVLLGGGGPALLVLVVGTLVATALVGLGIEVLRGRLAARLGADIIHDVRFDLYQAIQGLSLQRHDKAPTGSLTARLTHDTMMVQWCFIDGIAYFVPHVLTIVFICALLFWFNWRLAFLVLVPIPAVALLTRWFYKRLIGMYHRYYQRRSRMTARATDTILGIRVVKAFSQEPREVSIFSQRSREMSNAVADAERFWATGYPMITFVSMAGTFLVWYFGGRSVMAHQADETVGMSLGSLNAYLMGVGMLYGPIQGLTRFADWVNRALTSAQRLFEITDSDQEVYEDPHAEPLDDPRGALTFQGVHFGYVKDKPVLKGVDLEVAPGEMIGLVGRSGVGKTTMTNLICRFYDVDEGALLLDGIDLRKIRLRDLRRHIGIVPQEPFLFNGTVAENIAYAKAGATRAEVIRAATAANAHGFIMRMPDGYDTRCGDRGSRLSAGEKQRVAIARAILHDPAILILDEATSSVDTETETMIQVALANLVKDRTTFAIAHRLSTLRNASRLVVLEDGKPAEIGTHNELLAKKGTYNRLVEMQSKLSAIKAVDG